MKYLMVNDKDILEYRNKDSILLIAVPVSVVVKDTKNDILEKIKSHLLGYNKDLTKEEVVKNFDYAMVFQQNVKLGCHLFIFSNGEILTIPYNKYLDMNIDEIMDLFKTKML